MVILILSTKLYYMNVKLLPPGKSEIVNQRKTCIIMRLST